LAALPLAPGGTLYAPLGLGHHVDHRIVQAAVQASDLRVTYYEDFPYAEDSQELAEAVAGAYLQPEVVALTETALQAKIAAIACYASQVSTFWSDPQEMGARVRAFAESIGDGQPGERYWVRTDVC
jgi:LmbE family N-acetylglucosaminyl deacetylase